jgi:hypothetical protein
MLGVDASMTKNFPSGGPDLPVVLESKTVEQLPCGGFFQDPLCLVGRRFIVTLPLSFNATTSRWEQSLSYYIYPHGVNARRRATGVRPFRPVIALNMAIRSVNEDGNVSGLWIIPIRVRQSSLEWREVIEIQLLPNAKYMLMTYCHTAY